MLNSVAAGRRHTARAIAWQGVATCLVALPCLWLGGRAAAAALVGGGAMVLAGWLASRIALGGGVGGAGVVLARLVLGVAAKWLVLAVTLLLGMAALRLPPLPMLAAAAAALAAQMLALALDRRNGQSA